MVTIFNADESTPEEVVITCSDSGQTKVKDYQTSNPHGSQPRPAFEGNLKIKASISMHRSQMKYMFWEKLLYVTAITIIVASITLKLFFDSAQSNAYQNHIRVNSIGGFMRTITYLSKAGTKFGISQSFPELNTSNYYNDSYFDPVILYKYDERLMINLLTITDFVGEQKSNMTLDELGRLFPSRFCSKS